jgi:hypothetical protein
LAGEGGLAINHRICRPILLEVVLHRALQFCVLAAGGAWMTTFGRRILRFVPMAFIGAMLSACSGIDQSPTLAAGSIESVDRAPSTETLSDAEAAEQPSPTTCTMKGETANCFYQAEGANRRPRRSR